MSLPNDSSRSALRETLWAFRREFVWVGLLSAIANLLMITPTLYMLQVYDRVMISQSTVTLMSVSMICLFMIGFMALAEWTRSRILVHAGKRLDQALGTKVFNASFDAAIGSKQPNPSRAFNDLLQLRQFITGQGVFALFDAPWAPIYIGVAYLLNPLLGALAVVFAAVQAALAWFGHRNTVEPAEAASQASADAMVFMQGKLRNAEVLESMGMVGNLLRRWKQRHGRALDRAIEAQAVNSNVATVSKFIRYVQQSLSLGAGALLVIDGQLSPGAMIAANLLMTRALTPIDQLVSSWRGFIVAKTAFDRLERLLEDYPERDLALRRMPPQGHVTLRGVQATAPGRQVPILRGVDLSVAAGTVVVVLGPSGSGKSTLARVLLGIWPDVQGEVLLDNLPVSSWDRIELGPHVGYLPQDVELFDGSIAENIARFDELDSERVIAAARCTGLHEMILRFPQGYETPMGEAGSLLSGGQRQRIALARAIYGDPKLVVLDEPNASLDDAGEAALAQTVKQLKARGSTVFLVTHRPGAVALADWLLVLKDGQVAASGPRDAVLAAMRPPASTSAPRPPSDALQPV